MVRSRFSPRKNNEGEVMQDKNISRWASYVIPDADGIKELTEALQKDDDYKMRSVLSSYASYDFLDSILDIYPPVIKEVAKKVLFQNSVLLDTDGKKLKRSGQLRPALPPIRAKKRSSSYKIAQIQKTGVSYKRDVPVKFKSIQLTFIRNHAHLSNKDLVVKYNTVFAKRSGSSIISKRYRIKAKKKKSDN